VILLSHTGLVSLIGSSHYIKTHRCAAPGNTFLSVFFNLATVQHPTQQSPTSCALPQAHTHIQPIAHTDYSCSSSCLEQPAQLSTGNLT
jgi:hypothetical protein